MLSACGVGDKIQGTSPGTWLKITKYWGQYIGAYENQSGVTSILKFVSYPAADVYFRIVRQESKFNLSLSQIVVTSGQCWNQTFFLKCRRVWRYSWLHCRPKIPKRSLRSFQNSMCSASLSVIFVRAYPNVCFLRLNCAKPNRVTNASVSMAFREKNACTKSSYWR